MLYLYININFFMTGTNLLNHIYVVAGFAAAASATLSIQEKPDLSLP